MGATILYVILPYVAIATFVIGILWRYRTDQYGWGARSTQLLEGRTLRVASIVFHLGVLAAIGGHILGVLIPKSFTDAFGLTDGAYHVLAVIGGVGAGTAVTAGFAIVVWRRIRYPRVWVTTTGTDLLIFGLLAIGIVTGYVATLANLGGAVEYRESIAPYFRELFILSPDAELMTGAGVTWIFQLHVISAWFLYMAWPFSRLVHAFSIPIDYFRRSPIPYRSHAGRPGRAETSPVRPVSRG